MPVVGKLSQVFHCAAAETSPKAFSNWGDEYREELMQMPDAASYENLRMSLEFVKHFANESLKRGSGMRRRNLRTRNTTMGET